MKKIIAASLLLISSSGFAASVSSYYCAQNFKMVQLGDTMAAVQTACGAPTSSLPKQVTNDTPVTQTQWIYSLGAFSVKGVSVFLPTLTVTFDQNQVVTSIQKAGLPITTAGSCGITGVVNIGDTMTRVLSLCGQPNYANTQQTTVTTTQNLMEWIYNFGPYRPQMIFDFDSNGKLIQINSGSLGS